MVSLLDSACIGSGPTAPQAFVCLALCLQNYRQEVWRLSPSESAVQKKVPCSMRIYRHMHSTQQDSTGSYAAKSMPKFTCSMYRRLGGRHAVGLRTFGAIFTLEIEFQGLGVLHEGLQYMYRHDSHSNSRKKGYQRRDIILFLPSKCLSTTTATTGRYGKTVMLPRALEQAASSFAE